MLANCGRRKSGENRSGEKVRKGQDKAVVMSRPLFVTKSGASGYQYATFTLRLI